MCPSFRPSFCLSRRFLRVLSFIFAKFWHGARIPCKVVHYRAGFSGKIFCPLNWENGPKMGPKQGFFDLLENLVINFYWIWSIMKIYIICCVPAQIPYLGKFLFLRYGPKCSQPIRLQDFLINYISRTNQWNSLIFYMLIQIHINQKLIKKFWGGHGQRWVWLAWSQDSKIDCMTRMSWWNKLIFCMLVQIQER